MSLTFLSLTFLKDPSSAKVCDVSDVACTMTTESSMRTTSITRRSPRSMRQKVALTLYVACLGINLPLVEAFFVHSPIEHVGRAIKEGNVLLAMRLSKREQHPLRGRSGLWKQISVRGGQQSSQPPQHNAAPTSTQMSSSPQTDKTMQTSGRSLTSYIIARFIQLLFKGMTLPFPLLRELGNVGDDDNGQAMLGFSLRECLLAIFSYLCLGTISYSFIFEKWPLVDSLYFSVVTFTSVGYGDLTPTTLAGKWFTCFFGLSGLAFLGAAISTIGSSLLGKQEEFIKASEEASRKRMKNIFEGMPQVVKSLRMEGKVNATVISIDDKQVDDANSAPVGWRASLQKAVLKIIPSLSFLWAGGMIMARIEGWKWTDSVYYSVISASTIGFGDFFPKTPLGRTWGIFFIPLAVAAAGDVLGNVGSSLVERRQAKAFKALMNRELTMDNLVAMDEDDNGQVSREEYVRFMLTEMGLVEPEEYDELCEQFKRLDVNDSGYLDKQDLQLMAKHRAAGTTSAQEAS